MAPAKDSGSSLVISQLQYIIFGYPLQLLGGFILFRLLWNKFQRHLVNVPGPALAAYTKFWRLHDVWKGKAHLTAIAVHRKYGSVVRIGPNHVSISDPSFIPIIYNIKENYTKSAFYPIQCISWKKQPEMNLFSTRDPNYHRAEKRKVGAAYSLPNLLESETAIDSCINLFMSRLDEYEGAKKPVDLGAWLQYFAFDVIGEVTFSSKLGFLEQGKDVDQMMHAIEGMLLYASLCGQVPEYHKFLLGNPLFSMLMPAMETWNQVLMFTLKAINGRASIKRDGELINADSEGRDMLSRWAYVKSSDPLKMSTRDIIVHLSTNVFAVGLLMERHVPAEGVEIAGHHIPGGTIVGINPWVTNRDATVFPDPDEFKPERWLKASESQLKQMDNILELNFGGGSRKCIGRNISMIEMQKVLPQLLRLYKVDLTYPEKEWEICNHWFVQQEGLICTLTRRAHE
ncbi:hypothetical protein LTR84_012300 [Exophiala bonariae]|uniref:Cytochrome P450 oxidoreductase n=1 Tax=Exophiala bonariae TaxID=1690606 RepID=A0AAV9NI98_9EURO|nr:hypothetical protein LTR84_012300 [Exophiala bonariae]